MPNGVSNVSLSQPNDYQLELADIERRKALAQALQQQGQQPLGGTEMVGGWAIPKSPMEGLGKAAQQVSGAYQQKQLLEEERGIGRKYQTDLADTLMRAQQAGIGTPGMPEQARQGPLKDDEGNDMPGVPAQPAVAPDRARMAQILMSHPATQAMGLQQSMQDSNMQRMAEAFGYGGQPAQPNAGASPAPNGQAQSPVAAAANAGIPKNIAMGLLLADPTGKLLATKIAESYAEQTKPINVRPGGTVYTPGQGAQFTAPNNGAQTNWQNGQPQVSAVPGAAQVAGQQAQAVAQGTHAGAAPYQMSAVNTEGAPTLMTNQQQIEAATGQPMPQPGQPTPVSPPGGWQVPPQVQQQRDQQAGQIIAREGQPNGGGAIPTPAVVAPRAPGLRLQDQDESSRQKKFGEEQAVLQAQAPQARASVADMTTNLQRMEDLASKVSASPALGRITGLLGALPNIPGSAAADVEANLNSLKSQVGFAVLQAMRDASKTGGALGAISDKENALLQTNLAALEKSQSPEAIRENLGKLIEYARGARERVQRAYSDTYERVVGNQGMQPTQRGAQPAAPTKPSPSVGKIVKWGDL